MNDWLPQNIVQRITTIVPPSRDGGDDLKCWPGDMKGELTVSTAYHLPYSTNYINNNEIWNQFGGCRCKKESSFLFGLFCTKDR